MERDIKRYLSVICVPAIILTGFGFYLLSRQSAAERIRVEKMRHERIENLAASIQDAVNESGKTGTVAYVALRDWKGGDDVDVPYGRFVWNPKKRLVWSEGLSETNCAEIASRARWNEWTAIGKKRARRGMMNVGTMQLLWGRVDDSAYGVVYRSFPLAEEESSFDFWSFVFIIVVLLLCTCSAGVWLMVRAAQKSRRDDKLKTDFLSNVSHELKTPLTGISIWAEMLNDGRLTTDEKRSRAYKTIVDENARMIRLVDNLLDFSRLEKGSRNYAFDKVDLSLLTANAVELVRSDFKKNGIELHTDENCEVQCDADAVKQIVLNLLGNAAKYAATDGPVEVVVSRDENCCSISVRDRGPGLSFEQRKRVFERFYQANDVLTSKKKGLGLGLSISLALAKDMGGKLFVDARDGGGCVFTLELPSERKVES